MVRSFHIWKTARSGSELRQTGSDHLETLIRNQPSRKSRFGVRPDKITSYKFSLFKSLMMNIKRYMSNMYTATGESEMVDGARLVGQFQLLGQIGPPPRRQVINVPVIVLDRSSNWGGGANVPSAF